MIKNVSQNFFPGKRKAFSSAIWYTASSFLTKGAGFLTVPIFTRLMTQEEFGTFNAFAAIQTILIIVVGLETFRTINRARFDFDAQGLQQYQLAMISLSGILALLVIGALYLWPDFFEQITGIQQQYLYFLGVYILLYPAAEIFQTLQRVRYKYKVATIATFSASASGILLSILLVLNMQDALLGRIIGQYSPFVLFGVIAFAYFLITARRFSLSHWHYGLRLAVPLVISSLGVQGLLLGSRIITQIGVDGQSMSYVALASTIASIIMILVTVLNQSWSPWLADCLTSGRIDSARSGFQLFFWMIVVLAVVLILMMPEVIFILGGSEYQPTLYVVPAMVAGVAVAMVCGQYVILHTHFKKVWWGSLLTLLVAVLNGVMTSVFLGLFGYVSVGWVLLASYIALVFSLKLLTRGLSIADPFPTLTIVSGTIVLVVAVLCSEWIYASGLDWVRFSFLIIALVTTGVMGKRFLKRRKARA